MEGGYFFPALMKNSRTNNGIYWASMTEDNLLYFTMKSFYVDSAVKQSDKLSSHTSHKTGYLCMSFCAVDTMIC